MPYQKHWNARSSDGVSNGMKELTKTRMPKLQQHEHCHNKLILRRKEGFVCAQTNIYIQFPNMGPDLVDLERKQNKIRTRFSTNIDTIDDCIWENLEDFPQGRAGKSNI